MRIWMIAPLGLAVLAAGCSGIQEQWASSSTSTETAAAGEAASADGRADSDATDAIDWRQQRRVSPEVGQADRTDTQPRSEPVPYNTTPSDVEDRPATASTARMERAAPVSDLTNEDVRQAQTTLADMGFYEGEIDGLYGPRSIAAVGEFQTQQNMPRTLALDDRTQQALRTRSAQGGSGGAKDARQAASGSGAGQAGTAQTSPASTGGEGGMAASGADAPSYRSAGQAQDGSVAGGYQVQELMGKQVTGPNEQPVGEIADVLIGEDNRASHVLLDVAGELGIGTDKQIAVPIARLSRSGDGFSTRLSREDLEAQPSYRREGDRWVQDGGGASGGN